MQPDRFRELIFEVINFAKRHHVETIEVWNLAENLFDASRDVGGMTFFREDQLGCFKWHGRGNSEDVAWLWNEKLRRFLPSVSS